jgi:hypothetical protein
MFEALNFRDLAKKISPAWLRTGIAEKLMYTIGLYFDALVELTDAAVRIRFPGDYGYESLPYLSRERGIRQGIGESNASFALRLNEWFETHKDRGGPYPMLEQIWHHYKDSPDGAFPVHLVYTSGARFDMGTDGVITRDADSFSTGLGPDDWAHWWLVYERPTPIADEGTWGDPGTWTDGGVWGSALSPEEVTDLRLIPTEWNNAYCLGHLVVLSPGQALWGVPEELWGSGGTWGEGTDSALVTVDIE